MKKLARQVDKDNIKGLNGQEIFDFAKMAKENNVSQNELSELLGINITQKRRVNSLNIQRNQDPGFEKAAEYYNNNMDYYQRADVTNKTYTNLQARLYAMEKAIDQAFIDCEAYKDIVIVPGKYYRFYPNFSDRLTNFDLDEIRNLTSKDMNALQELKDKIEYIVEEANGNTEHNELVRTDYDVEALAQKHLGISYEEFASKYKDELEFCKNVTSADFNSMTAAQKEVYRKAKAYAAEMLTTTINEAHTVNWDAGERKLEQTLEATEDMFPVSNFETDGISEAGLNEIKSGIMYKAFEEALITAYNEIELSGIESAESDEIPQKAKKVVVNGRLLIFSPDGSVYDSSGKRLK